MKKTAILCIAFFLIGTAALFAVSYDNNEFQRKVGHIRHWQPVLTTKETTMLL